jgi:signal transduction histidine kinase
MKKKRVSAQRTPGRKERIGIAPNDQRRIFGIFERVHSTQQYEGTGIGLAIVAKAVERMGGHVGVESADGRGSRCWLELSGATG